MPRTWEYDWLDFKGKALDDFEHALDEMGKQGWEVVTTIQLHDVYLFLLKREASDIPDAASQKGV